MPTLYLPNCADASGATAPNSPVDFSMVPTCASGVTWVQVEASSIQFDLATWLETPENQAQFAGFFGAGFMLVATFYAAGWGVQRLLSLLRGH